jgi:hypothetical protein
MTYFKLNQLKNSMHLELVLKEINAQLNSRKRSDSIYSPIYSDTVESHRQIQFQRNDHSGTVMKPSIHKRDSQDSSLWRKTQPTSRENLNEYEMKVMRNDTRNSQSKSTQQIYEQIVDNTFIRYQKHK